MEGTVALSAEVLQFYDNVYEVTHRLDRAEVGTQVEVQVGIENRGNGPVGYSLDVLAPSSAWNAAFDKPTLEVPGYGWASSTLTFTVPDNAISGSYDFTIGVVPDDGDGLSHGVSMSVLQFHAMEVTVTSETPTVTQGMPAVVNLRLSNLGNGVETAKVIVPDMPGLWSLDQESSEYEVGPFGDLEVALTFHTHRESPGGQSEVVILTRYGPAPQLTAENEAFVIVRTRPDLRIRQGELNVSEVEPLVGSLVQLSVRVENTGETPARDVYMQFYVNSVPLGQPLYTTSIDPSEIQTHTMVWTANVSGLHQLSVVIDSTKDVDETNENNNRAEAQVSVQALDLQATPGFGATALLAALAATVVLADVRRRR
jgi:hypothetical protein